LQDLLDAAVATVGADQGTLQLLERESLRMVAQRRHKAPFLKSFESAETLDAVCREAARRRERVLVPDVEESAFFSGTQALEVLRSAGIRSMQSTPMMSRSGKPVGILSTHWGKPHCPEERDLLLIDLLVRQAADLVELARAQEALRTSESTLRNFYESAPLMMGVVEVPADNSDIVHIYDNPATDRFFGRSPGSTVGQSALKLGRRRKRCSAGLSTTGGPSTNAGRCSLSIGMRTRMVRFGSRQLWPWLALEMKGERVFRMRCRM